MTKTPVFRGGKVHVLSERCSTCIFRPGNMMHLNPGRLKEMVDGCRSELGGNIICHQTIDAEQAMCRGFYDNYGQDDALIRLAGLTDRIEEQAPPEHWY